MNIIAPLPIGEMQIAASSIPEPAPGETVWVSAASYTAGDLRIRTTTHRVYIALQTHTDRTASPEDDPLFWRDLRPTRKYAPFDIYKATAAFDDMSLSYTLTPGFADAVSVYGLEGISLRLTVREGAMGPLTYDQTFSLFEPALGLYEYLFRPSRPIDRIIANSLPLHPMAHIGIEITGLSLVSVGIINVGQFRQLVNPATGGTEYGAIAEPKTSSFIRFDEFQELTVVRRPAATDMRATVFVPITDANYALRSVQDHLDVPVSWIATDYAGFEGLNVFGLGRGQMQYESPTHARLNIDVTGII